MASQACEFLVFSCIGETPIINAAAIAISRESTSPYSLFLVCHSSLSVAFLYKKKPANESLPFRRPAAIRLCPRLKHSCSHKKSEEYFIPLRLVLLLRMVFVNSSQEG